MGNLIGQNLGKYQLIERMAQGGMAEVYKAFQPGVERIVVVKVLHSHLTDSGNFVARFQREARAIGRLQHPHIVRIIDSGIEEDNYYIVMDFVQGGTLGEHLKVRGQLPVDDTLRLGLQLANALAAAHDQGIIHRDIKPSNILFVDESSSQVVLTDFGLASLRDDTEASLTLTGTMVGTPTYMSPEAVIGDVCDARADVYSLGVVLYELLTGRTPYLANTPYSMLMKQTSEPMPLPRTLNPALPEVVEALLLKTLAKEPSARYQSATELAAAIRQTQQALSGKEVKQESAVAKAPVATAPMAAAPVATVPVATAPVAKAPVATVPVASAPVAAVPVVPALQRASPGEVKAWLSLAFALVGVMGVAVLTAAILLQL